VKDVDGDLAKNQSVFQNLKVDAWYDVRIKFKEDSISKAITFPAFILAEMQVVRCAMAVRLLSYACMIFSRSKVDLSSRKTQIPPPVYAFAFCMWDQAGKGLMEQRSIATSDIDGDENNTPSTELSIGNIYLGNPLEAKFDSTTVSLKNRDVVLKQGQNELKEKIVALVRKSTFDEVDSNLGSNVSERSTRQAKRAAKKTKSADEVNGEFDKLDEEYKKLYLWLEFIKLAHLMTPKDVENSLQLVKSPDKQTFQQAYNIIKIEDKTMSDIQKNDLGVYAGICNGLIAYNQKRNKTLEKLGKFVNGLRPDKGGQVTLQLKALQNILELIPKTELTARKAEKTSKKKDKASSPVKKSTDGLKKEKGKKNPKRSDSASPKGTRANGGGINVADPILVGD
jgi:hypothetical protein